MRRRWSDNEKQFGPLTYSRDQYAPTWTAVIDSGEEEYEGCRLRMSGFGHTVLFELPQWLLQPYREKVTASWDAATVARMGRDWYYNESSRKYGFSISEGHLNVYYGRQTDDSSTEQRWSKFLPWTQWRFHRFSLYGLEGEQVWTQIQVRRKHVPGEPFDQYEKQRAAEETCPKVVFHFLDYDSEPIDATTFIEEREWLFGEGHFKWLSFFRKPKIRRSLAIRFSSEVGPKKGSWKGGTVSHGIEMKPGELHLGAFGRYCAENRLTLLMPTTEAA